MAFRKRRKRRIRERRENIFKNKKGISKEKNNIKRVPRITIKNLERNTLSYIFLSLRVFLIMGLLTKSLESNRSTPTGLTKTIWEFLSLFITQDWSTLSCSDIFISCSDKFGFILWSKFHQYWPAFPLLITKIPLTLL